ncbi:MAG: ABC-type iron transport system, ATPase component [Candidatus Fermentimicrarchaeum limneticum]|uniref:Molybdate/tungstate import ATP-binding protein WtpC n=1 Tax=Fermentimicrarchaeum limneticum TaxID=2795018 RepID=A0A7D5XD45_FERL1|nr:MAG: ABC-type iron transport system, ATPase component [Candidatus Fermentimicrarchaeum limneticum]
MPNVKVANVSKFFGNIKALENINLEVDDGEYVVLLGPSGCGKTTLLKIIAGMWEPTAGKVYIDGSDVTDLPPEDRNIGFVFQNYALFPHLNVFDNTIYGPVVRGKDSEESRRNAREMLHLVRLAARHDAFPVELSGGMQQRLAVARALTTGSSLLFLDEPLSALDAKIGAELRSEMRKMIKDLKLTAIHVTHNQEEAMEVADKIVVMRRGRVEQVGSPEQIYRNPANLFVAHFLGDANFIEAAAVDHGTRCKLKMLNWEMDIPKVKPGAYVAVVRPEKVEVGDGGAEGVVKNFRFLGGVSYVEVGIRDESVISRFPSGREYELGERVRICFKPEDVKLFKYPDEGLKEALRVD